MIPVKWYGRQVMQLFKPLDPKEKWVDGGLRMLKAAGLIIGTVSFVVIAPMTVIGLLAKCVERKSGEKASSTPLSGENTEGQTNPEGTRTNSQTSTSSSSSASASAPSTSSSSSQTSTSVGNPQSPADSKTIEKRFNRLCNRYTQMFPPPPVIQVDPKTLRQEAQRLREDIGIFWNESFYELTGSQLANLRRIYKNLDEVNINKYIERCKGVEHQLPDGNCLFHACLAGLKKIQQLNRQIPKDHLTLRKQVVDWIEEQIKSKSPHHRELLKTTIRESIGHTREAQLEHLKLEIASLELEIASLDAIKKILSGSFTLDRRQQQVQAQLESMEKRNRELSSAQNSPAPADDSDITDYLRNMGRDRTFGSQTEMYAICNMYNVTIFTYKRKPRSDGFDEIPGHRYSPTYLPTDNHPIGNIGLLLNNAENHFDLYTPQPNLAAAPRAQES